MNAKYIPFKYYADGEAWALDIWNRIKDTVSDPNTKAYAQIEKHPTKVDGEDGCCVVIIEDQRFPNTFTQQEINEAVEKDSTWIIPMNFNH